MNTSTFVKQSRKALGLTQYQFSKVIKKDRSNISNYETGRTIPPGNIVLKLIEMRFPNLCLFTTHTCNSQSSKNQGMPG